MHVSSMISTAWLNGVQSLADLGRYLSHDSPARHRQGSRQQKISDLLKLVAIALQWTAGLTSRLCRRNPAPFHCSTCKTQQSE